MCDDCQMFTVLNDEICRLSRVLEEFDRPFDADPATLRLYKKVHILLLILGRIAVLLSQQ